MSYLIDTCLVSELRKAQPDNNVVSWLNQCPESQLMISALTIGELQYGITLLEDGLKKQDLQAWLDQIVNGFSNRIISIDDEVAAEWGILRAETKNQGQPISVVDGLLAATCQYYDLILVTRNVKDFAGTGTRLLNPWVSGNRILSFDDEVHDCNSVY